MRCGIPRTELDKPPGRGNLLKLSKYVADSLNASNNNTPKRLKTKNQNIL